MIEPVLLTEMTLPDSHPRAGQRCPVYGFVIHHLRGPVLVDTGVGTGDRYVDSTYAPVHRPIGEALAEVGVALSQVAMVINSHLHLDHCGNNRRFPGTPLVVQRDEYELAAGPRYTVPEWVEFPGNRWELVEGEVEVLAGVTVVPTPGHTGGHQSVMVTHPEGVDVIAAQAVYDPEELEAERSSEPLSPQEAEQTAGAARRIKAAAPRRVYFSHDARTWAPRWR